MRQLLRQLVVPLHKRSQVHGGQLPVAQVGDAGQQQLADLGQLRVQAGVAAANRLTNSSAVSQTSRQPLSIVSECPRLGIDLISVTPGLRFCLL